MPLGVGWLDLEFSPHSEPCGISQETKINFIRNYREKEVSFCLLHKIMPSAKAEELEAF